MTRLQMFLSLDARDQLDRLAVYYDDSVTELVEQLAAATERAVEARLSDKALKACRAGYNNTVQ
jgi:hypothetical protein